MELAYIELNYWQILGMMFYLCHKYIFDQYFSTYIWNKF